MGKSFFILYRKIASLVILLFYIALYFVHYTSYVIINSKGIQIIARSEELENTSGKGLGLSLLILLSFALSLFLVKLWHTWKVSLYWILSTYMVLCMVMMAGYFAANLYPPLYLLVQSVKEVILSPLAAIITLFLLKSFRTS